MHMMMMKRKYGIFLLKIHGIKLNVLFLIPVKEYLQQLVLGIILNMMETLISYSHLAQHIYYQITVIIILILVIFHLLIY